MKNWYDYDLNDIQNHNNNNNTNRIENENKNENITTNINECKYNFQHIYEYSENDLEIDLLNIYSSLYLFTNDSINNIKGIDEIKNKYTKLKNRIEKNLVINNEIKELIKTIDTEINNYDLKLKTEINKTKKITDFKCGVCVGLGISVIIGLCTYFYTKIGNN